MEGTVDSFDFVLAEALGKHLHEIRELPNMEVEEWKAFMNFRREMEEFEAKKAG